MIESQLSETLVASHMWCWTNWSCKEGIQSLTLQMESWLREVHRSTKATNLLHCRAGVWTQLCLPPKCILPIDCIHAPSKTRLKIFLPQAYSFLSIFYFREWNHNSPSHPWRKFGNFPWNWLFLISHFPSVAKPSSFTFFIFVKFALSYPQTHNFYSRKFKVSLSQTRRAKINHFSSSRERFHDSIYVKTSRMIFLKCTCRFGHIPVSHVAVVPHTCPSSLSSWHFTFIIFATSCAICHFHLHAFDDATFHAWQEHSSLFPWQILPQTQDPVKCCILYGHWVNLQLEPPAPPPCCPAPWRGLCHSLLVKCPLSWWTVPSLKSGMGILFVFDFWQPVRC